MSLGSVREMPRSRLSIRIYAEAKQAAVSTDQYEWISEQNDPYGVQIHRHVLDLAAIGQAVNLKPAAL